MFLAFKTTPSASAGAQPSTAPRKHMDAAQDILTIVRPPRPSRAQDQEAQAACKPHNMGGICPPYAHYHSSLRRPWPTATPVTL
ncbi:hypothetical protein MY4824_009870 [Beauveria thailandica]